MAYDASKLTQTAVYNNTPNGNQASFWAGGAAPAVDAAGNLYVVGGNGSFDSSGKGADDGESYLKLSTAGGLALADFFTPYNYVSLNAADLDVGSAGVALLGDEAGSAQHPHLMAGAGKEGRIYLLDRDNLGKLAAGSDSQIVQSLPGAIGGLFGNPAYFNKTLYFCGSSDALKAFPIANAQMAAKPSSQSAAKFAFPGCLPTISAGGTANGIVWVLDPAAILHAYDATNLAAELYNSNQNKTRDGLGATVKYSAPTVVNGKVYAGTESTLAVYGLLSAAAAGVSNAASGDASALAPGSIASIYGTALAPSAATASGFPLPVTLGGAAVMVNGIAAPLFYASPSQINFQVPFEISATAPVVVNAGSAQTGMASAPVRPTAPGIFLLAQGRAAALNQDGSVNGAANPAAASSVISVYATGLGAVNPAVATGARAPTGSYATVAASVTATVGGVAAGVLFAGLAPGYVGLYQVNLMLPALPAGDYPVQIVAGGVASNLATISVH
jgi:uncharacterized protein (TIGR03437 family)